MLKAVVSSLDDIQDALHELYEPKDDQFVLKIAEIQNHPDVSSLSNSYQAEKGRRVKQAQEIQALRDAAKAYPDDFDPEVWASAKSGKTDQAAIEAAKLEVRQALEGEVGEWKSKYEGLTAEIRSNKATVALTEALTKAGVEGAFLEAGRAMIGGKIEFDEDGSPRIQSKLGPQTIGEYVERWAKDEGKPFVKPPSGGGTPPATHPGSPKASAKTQAIARAVPGFSELPVQ